MFTSSSDLLPQLQDFFQQGKTSFYSIPHLPSQCSGAAMGGIVHTVGENSQNAGHIRHLQPAGGTSSVDVIFGETGTGVLKDVGIVGGHVAKILAPEPTWEPRTATDLEYAAKKSVSHKEILRSKGLGTAGAGGPSSMLEVRPMRTRTRTKTRTTTSFADENELALQGMPGTMPIESDAKSSLIDAMDRLQKRTTLSLRKKEEMDRYAPTGSDAAEGGGPPGFMGPVPERMSLRKYIADGVAETEEADEADDGEDDEEDGEEDGEEDDVEPLLPGMGGGSGGEEDEQDSLEERAKQNGAWSGPLLG